MGRDQQKHLERDCIKNHYFQIIIEKFKLNNTFFLQF